MIELKVVTHFFGFLGFVQGGGASSILFLLCQPNRRPREPRAVVLAYHPNGVFLKSAPVRLRCSCLDWPPGGLPPGDQPTGDHNPGGPPPKGPPLGDRPPAGRPPAGRHLVG